VRNDIVLVLVVITALAFDFTNGWSIYEIYQIGHPAPAKK
jgi:hypothetical protein